MLKVLTVVVLGLVAVFLAARIYGTSRWSAGTQSLRSSLDEARVPLVSRTMDFADLEGLPAPVQRYFRNVLPDHSRVISGVRLHHRGTFNMSETAEQWKAFTSDQHVVTIGDMRRSPMLTDGPLCDAPPLPQPVGCGVQAIALFKSQALPRWQSALFLVGVLLIATPDGVELVNLTASVMIAVAFVPYGIHLMRTERPAE
jgi:hypothetical protein